MNGVPEETRAPSESLRSDLTVRVEKLDRDLFEFKAESKAFGWLVKVGGVLLLGFLGYTSFFQIPAEVGREIKSQATGEVQAQLKNLLDEARADRLSIAKLLTESQERLEVSIPVGTVAAWPGEPPQQQGGWIVCDGRMLPIEEYQVLHALLGQRYGEEGILIKEDGRKVAAFRVPDYQGVFLRGLDLARKRDVDQREVGSYQGDQIGAHSHGYQDWYGFSGGHGADIHAGDSAQKTRNANTAVAGGNETRPKNITVHYLIKAK